MMIVCKICNKKQKENTEGNKKYCQGHDMFSIKDSMIDVMISNNNHIDNDVSELTRRIFQEDLKGGK